MLQSTVVSNMRKLYRSPDKIISREKTVAVGQIVEYINEVVDGFLKIGCCKTMALNLSL